MAKGDDDCDDTDLDHPENQHHQDRLLREEVPEVLERQRAHVLRDWPHGRQVPPCDVRTRRIARVLFDHDLDRIDIDQTHGVPVGITLRDPPPSFAARREVPCRVAVERARLPERVGPHHDLGPVLRGQFDAVPVRVHRQCPDRGRDERHTTQDGRHRQRRLHAGGRPWSRRIAQTRHEIVDTVAAPRLRGLGPIEGEEVAQERCDGHQ